jgi:DNA polymerase I
MTQTTRNDVIAFLRRHFQFVIVADTEYGADPNKRPEPRCFVGRELFSGRVERRWLDHTDAGECPFPTDSRALWAFYYSSGDLQVMKRIGWGMPTYVFDISPEFFLLINDGAKHGRSVLHVAAHFMLPHIEKAEKEQGRNLARRGGPYTQSERNDLLDYCESDATLETEAFLKTLEFALTGFPDKDDLYIWQAINRGRYFKASAHMEWVGIPIKVDRFERYREARPTIIEDLIREYDPNHDVFNERFELHHAQFMKYVTERDIPWNTYPSGQPILNDEYLKAQSKTYPAIRPIAILNAAKKLIPNRKEDLEIGADGFARCLLSAFQTKTGRTHPRASGFVPGRAAWERQRFIGPPPDFAIAYLDYTAQELGVAAIMSGDERFWIDYLSGDLHLATAKTLGMIPPGGEAEAYPTERKTAKEINFAILYGSSPEGLAAKIPIPGFTPASGASLIQSHRRAYRTLHAWIMDRVRSAYWHREISTRLGWRMLASSENVKPNTLRNWLIQATAGEITREAVCRMVEADIQVCCPVHDAVLIIAPQNRIEQDITIAMKIMGDASEAIIGVRLLVKKPDPIFYPNTLCDGKLSEIIRFIDPYIIPDEQEFEE